MTQHGIECPKCSTLHVIDGSADDDPDERLITYWGGEGENRHEVECDECEHSFWVLEHVTRSWIIVEGAS